MTATELQTPTTLVRLGAQHLKSNGSDTPRLDAELLVAHALGIRRLDLYLQFDRPLETGEVDTIRELVRRRGRGEPVAYITGEKEFYGRRFLVNSHVLIPRPDSEALITVLLEWVAQKRPDGDVEILDLGTGSGCLAITAAAELEQARVTAVDVSSEAVRCVVANAELNDVAARVDAVCGCWWEPLAADRVFDIVISNPPYITAEEMDELPRDVGRYEPDLALRADGDGLSSYREILGGLTGRRAPALLLFEVDYRRAIGVAEVVAQQLPDHSIRIEKDLAGRQRVVVAEEL